MSKQLEGLQSVEDWRLGDNTNSITIRDPKCYFTYTDRGIGLPSQVIDHMRDKGLTRIILFGKNTNGRDVWGFFK